VTELKPDDALAYFDLGHCLRQRGDRPGAMSAYRSAVLCKPHLREAHVALAELLAEAGHFEAAFRSARDALALDPENEQAQKLLRVILPRLAQCCAF
jgi:Flp pilus assembly protein TadD